MFNFFKNSLSEKSGKPSNIRILSSFWVLGILTSIIFLCVKNNTFPTVPSEIIYSIVGVLGVKAYQRSKEEEIQD